MSYSKWLGDLKRHIVQKYKSAKLIKEFDSIIVKGVTLPVGEVKPGQIWQNGTGGLVSVVAVGEDGSIRYAWEREGHIYERVSDYNWFAYSYFLVVERLKFVEPGQLSDSEILDWIEAHPRYLIRRDALSDRGDHWSLLFWEKTKRNFFRSLRELVQFFHDNPVESFEAPVDSVEDYEKKAEPPELKPLADHCPASVFRCVIKHTAPGRALVLFTPSGSRTRSSKVIRRTPKDRCRVHSFTSGLVIKRKDGKY